MEANVDYWRDPPRIETLVWEFIQDPQTRLNALLDGSAHAIDRVPPEHLPLLEEQRRRSTLQSVTGIESVNLFVRPGRLPLWDENADFRRAVNWSIDRQPLVESLVLGNSQAAQSFLPTNTLYFAGRSSRPTPSIRRWPPRSSSRRRRRRRAGVRALGGRGVPAPGPEVVQAIVAQMEQVGLKPSGRHLRRRRDDRRHLHRDGTGAMYHISWASQRRPHHAAAVYSSAFAWYFGDETLQALIDQGQTTLDPAQREQVYADLQAHMWEQAWHVPLYNSRLHHRPHGRSARACSCSPTSSRPTSTRPSWSGSTSDDGSSRPRRGAAGAHDCGRGLVLRAGQMLLVVLAVVTITFFVLRLATGDPARLVNPPGTPEDVDHPDPGAARHRPAAARPVRRLPARPCPRRPRHLVPRRPAGARGGGLGAPQHLGLGRRGGGRRRRCSPSALGVGGRAPAERAGSTAASCVFVAVAQATPAFWLGVVLVFVFSLRLGWFPAIDMTGPRSFVLPVVTLAITLMPGAHPHRPPIASSRRWARTSSGRRGRAASPSGGCSSSTA